MQAYTPAQHKGVKGYEIDNDEENMDKYQSLILQGKLGSKDEVYNQRAFMQTKPYTQTMQEYITIISMQVSEQVRKKEMRIGNGMQEINIKCKSNVKWTFEQNNVEN